MGGSKEAEELRKELEALNPENKQVDFSPEGVTAAVGEETNDI